MAKGNIEIDRDANFINRELSWLDFNFRVLSEAKSTKNLLFERMKFLSITASNLDEFFMIRVASLKDMVNAECEKSDIAGLTPTQQLKLITEKTHVLVDAQYGIYNRIIRSQLKAEKLRIVKIHEKLTEEQKEFVDRYFEEIVYPVLTPMAVDSSRPFPLIRNKSLNIGALLESSDDLKKKADNQKNKAKEEQDGESSKKGKVKKKNDDKDKDELEFATVQVPSGLPRFVEIPSSGDDVKTVILLEEIIERHLDKLFLNHKVVCAHPYRVMRNADLTIDEEDAADLLKEIQKQLKKRQWGEAIRLDVEDDMDRRLLKVLKKELNIHDDDVYKIHGPIDLTFLMKLYGTEGFEHLKNTPYEPQPHPDIDPEVSIFDSIKKADILLHHPYQSFDPVVDFVRQAAKDKDVLAIKQTLYRVSGNSPIIASLAEAAENGKQVTVLVELKARFDEENNINWAKMLEKAGCHVIYGLRGLKTHSKITLVVRKEKNSVKRYVHLGTGNYNDSTAKIYTDMGLLTCDTKIGEDATAVFNMLSGYSEPEVWNKLAIAPLWLRDKFASLIKREITFAKAGKKAFIKAKMNSLCDKKIIMLLYEASQAGVKIDLVVRGICCLRAGVPGLSENIHVRSIVGTFLEHSRIFYFHNNGKEEVYMGSADWMPRNLDKRVEIMFPVEKAELKKEVIHILDIQLADNIQAQVMDAQGNYKKVDRRGKKPVDAQSYFCKEAEKKIKAKKQEDIKSGRTFEPMTAADVEKKK
ncbi:MAG: RNA degradosome polyphosphate kinase [Lachnospiraceae bacterium]|nr:RNA degradosome polyphosphate kinase [Lachnospiraceae bacterium]